MSDPDRSRAKDHPLKVLSALYTLTRDKNEECFSVESICEKDNSISNNFCRYCLEDFENVGYVKRQFLGEDDNGNDVFVDEQYTDFDEIYWRLLPKGIAAYEAGFGTGNYPLDHTGLPTLNLNLTTCLLYFYCTWDEIKEFTTEDVAHLFKSEQAKKEIRAILDLLEVVGILSGHGILTRKFSFTDKAKAVISASVKGDQVAKRSEGHA